MSFTISIAQLIVAVATIATPLFGILLYLVRLDRRLSMWLVEHEMIVSDYAERKGIPVSELPTRRKAGW